MTENAAIKDYRKRAGKRVFQRLYKILLVMAFVLVLTPLAEAEAEEDLEKDEVNYLEASVDAAHKVTYSEKNVEAFYITKDVTEMSDGWYVAPEDSITINKRITIKGTVNLILRDGYSLEAKKGITTTGATLNIYGQEKNTGELIAGKDIVKVTEGGIEEETFIPNGDQAGIGGVDGPGGTLTIHGGVIEAYGSGEHVGYLLGAGIGGGVDSEGNGCDGGTITIYGGSVTASGQYGAGIGGGSSYYTSGEGDFSGFISGKKGGSGGKLTIYGGDVFTGSASSSAIGGGCGYDCGGDGGSVIVYGGNVVANYRENDFGVGIGGGAGIMSGGKGANVEIYGGKVTATGGDNSPDSAGVGKFTAGIGGGYCTQQGGKGGDGGSVLIKGGIVDVKGGPFGVGIGGGGAFNGTGGNGAEVKIYGGQVDVAGGFVLGSVYGLASDYFLPALDCGYSLLLRYPIMISDPVENRGSLVTGNSVKVYGSSTSADPENLSEIQKDSEGNYEHYIYMYFRDDVKASELSYEVKEFGMRVTDGKGVTNPLTNPKNLAVTYQSNDTSVATVDPETGEVIALKEGTAVITASPSQEGYEGTASYTVYVSDGFAEIEGHSLTLDGGTIGVNFFLNLGDYSPDNIEVLVSFKDNSSTPDFTWKTVGDETFLCFTQWVNAKEMTEKIGVFLACENEEGTLVLASDDYSVRAYYDAYVAKGYGDEKTLDLMKALLVYGGMAQIYFDNYNSDNMADEGIEQELPTIPVYKASASGRVPEGLDDLKASLLLESDTSVRVYFTCDGDIAGYTFRVNGSKVEPVYVGDSKYYIEMSHIQSYNLDKTFEFVFRDNARYRKFSYGPMCYAYSVQENPANLAIEGLVKALYLYNQKAKAYIDA